MKHIFFILFLLCSLASCAGSRAAVAPAAAPQSGVAVPGKQAHELAATVAKSYKPWQEVALKGKVRLDGVPIPLTLKAYMVRSRSIIMSLSAPLLGEVGRVEVTPDSMLVVNKRAKLYARENVASHLSDFGATLADAQDLLLGRVFVLGSGTLSPGNASLLEISEGPDGNFILTPRHQDERAEYGFTVSPAGRMLMAAAFTPDERYLAQAEYEYNGSKSVDVSLTLKFGKKSFPLSMSLSAPDYAPTPLEPVEIGSKWKRVTLKALFSSFK